MSKRFEDEYLREEREAWEALEEKIGAETIDCRNKVTPEMRKWFVETFDFKTDDESICMAWKTRNVGRKIVKAEDNHDS